MNKTEALQLTEELQKLQANMPYFEIVSEAFAKQAKVKYDAFLKAGFSTEQALYLCKGS